MNATLRPNGLYHCKIDDEAKIQITEMYQTISTLHEDIKHLKTISDTLEEIKTGLLNAVLGKEIVPLSITQALLDGQRKSYVSIIKTLCWAFGSILLVIIGLKYLAPHLLGGN